MAKTLGQVANFSPIKSVKSNFKLRLYISFVNKAVSERMLAHPSEECGVGEIERGGDNPLGIKKRKNYPVTILVP